MQDYHNRLIHNLSPAHLERASFTLELRRGEHERVRRLLHLPNFELLGLGESDE
jgi:hypothetical protein